MRRIIKLKIQQIIITCQYLLVNFNCWSVLLMLIVLMFRNFS